jgi:hypothetical protein
MPTPLPSRLDANQVLQGAYDEASGRLRTDAEATIVNAEIDVQLDSLTDSVAIGDLTGNILDINTDGSANTIQLNSLLNFKFDSIYPTYPSSTVEVYTYRNLGVIVGVITVTYVDSSKNEITSIVRV